MMPCKFASHGTKSPTSSVPFSIKLDALALEQNLSSGMSVALTPIAPVATTGVHEACVGEREREREC
jgi:hypothetical protein